MCFIFYLDLFQRFVTLDHKTDFFMPTIIRIWSKVHVPWIYFVSVELDLDNFKGNFLNILYFFAPWDSYILAKYCPILTNHKEMLKAE